MTGRPPGPLRRCPRHRGAQDHRTGNEGGSWRVRYMNGIEKKWKIFIKTVGKSGNYSYFCIEKMEENYDKPKAGSHN